LTDIRQAQTPRRALQQPHVQFRFDRADVLAGHRGRQVEPPRGGSEAAFLDSGDKHADGRQAIHARLDPKAGFRNAFACTAFAA
jgi:hypothetical protein